MTSAPLLSRNSVDSSGCSICYSCSICCCSFCCHWICFSTGCLCCCSLCGFTCCFLCSLGETTLLDGTFCWAEWVASFFPSSSPPPSTYWGPGRFSAKTVSSISAGLGATGVAGAGAGFLPGYNFEWCTTGPTIRITALHHNKDWPCTTLQGVRHL